MYLKKKAIEKTNKKGFNSRIILRVQYEFVFIQCWIMCLDFYKNARVLTNFVFNTAHSIFNILLFY